MPPCEAARSRAVFPQRPTRPRGAGAVSGGLGHGAPRLGRAGWPSAGATAPACRSTGNGERPLRAACCRRCPGGRPGTECSGRPSAPRPGPRASP
eukprot:115275-Pyramimonas_sp.AAC.1